MPLCIQESFMKTFQTIYKFFILVLPVLAYPEVASTGDEAGNYGKWINVGRDATKKLFPKIDDEQIQIVSKGMGCHNLLACYDNIFINQMFPIHSLGTKSIKCLELADVLLNKNLLSEEVYRELCNISKTPKLETLKSFCEALDVYVSTFSCSKDKNVKNFFKKLSEAKDVKSILDILSNNGTDNILRNKIWPLMHTERLLAFYLFFDSKRCGMDYEKMKEAIEFISRLDMCKNCEKFWSTVVSKLECTAEKEIDNISDKYKTLVGSFK